jgi:hypothetical protein
MHILPSHIIIAILLKARFIQQLWNIAILIDGGPNAVAIKEGFTNFSSVYILTFSKLIPITMIPLQFGSVVWRRRRP